ncbi:MAG: response regulator [Thiolinea sp.]
MEDDNGTLQRLAEVISDEPGLELVGMAMNFADASQWLENNSLDVLLTDLGLPDGNGKQLIDKPGNNIRQQKSWWCRALGDENSVVEAIKAGAGGYLLKDESHEHIAGVSASCCRAVHRSVRRLHVIFLITLKMMKLLKVMPTKVHRILMCC